MLGCEGRCVRVENCGGEERGRKGTGGVRKCEGRCEKVIWGVGEGVASLLGSGEK